MKDCTSCGKPVGSWAYLSHGDRFCSIKCMNKVYKLAENAEIFY